MGIRFEQLEPPKWTGPTPDPVVRDACVLGKNCIIDPPVVLSPMAAVTNAPFRTICRDMGAGMVVTEMVNAVGLANGDPKTLALLDLSSDESPLSIQIYGKDPGAMAAAAQAAQELGAQSVDVNMGCPMRKVVSSGHGAALLCNPTLVQEIFEAMSRAVTIPVTGKTRAGWADSDAVDIAKIMEDAGAAGITIHGRTRCDMYDGHVDLAIIREVKKAVTIPVIGNGDVRDYVSARRMFSITGCDAVMVARGCLGNPWVFQELAADLSGHPIPPPPTPAQKRTVLMRHVNLYEKSYGVRRTTLEIRKHLLWYFRHTDAEKTLRMMLKNIHTIDDIYHAIDVALHKNSSTDLEMP